MIGSYLAKLTLVAKSKAGGRSTEAFLGYAYNL